MTNAPMTQRREDGEERDEQAAEDAWRARRACRDHPGRTSAAIGSSRGVEIGPGGRSARRRGSAGLAHAVIPPIAAPADVGTAAAPTSAVRGGGSAVADLGRAPPM